ncbi:hypothetical protein JW698_01025 [Candidatus Wolfebacteria bacterium]|nr:hypothetical protein [Candidatus Wolfebacteria bacterium]
MLENPKQYNLEQAENEAGEIRKVIENGKSNDYKESEKIVEWRKKIDALDYKNFDFNILSEIPIQFHHNIAIKFIEAKGEYFIAENLEKFQELNHQEIALKLIRAGSGEYVVKNLKKFHDVVQKDIVVELIKTKDLVSVAWGLGDRFKTITCLDKEVAEMLIENDREDQGFGASVVSEHLECFKGIDQGIALKLIESKHAGSVVRNINFFSNINQQEIALKIIDSPEYYYIDDILKKFSNLNYSELAFKCVEYGYDHYSKFFENCPAQYLNNELAINLINAGHENVVDLEFEHFSVIKKDAVIKIIEKLGSNASGVAKCLNKFRDSDREEILIKMIELCGRIDMALDNSIDIPETTWNRIYPLLLEKKYDRELIIDHIDKFKNANHSEIAMKSMEDREELDISKLKNLNSEVALKMIGLFKENGMRYEDKWQIMFEKNISNFDNLNKSVAVELFKKNEINVIANNTDRFNLREIIQFSLENNQIDLLDTILDRMSKASAIYHKEVALMLIDAGKGDLVDKYNNNFYGEFFEQGRKEGLMASEFILIDNKADELSDLNKIEKYKKIYEILKNKHHNWQDNENIIKPFEDAASIFGYNKMFKYLGRPQLTRHDGLHNFLQIIKSYEASGLKATTYYNNILAQVANDDGQYYEGTAHHHLNSLVGSIDYNFNDVAEKVREYSGIEKLQGLMIELGETKNIFSSWKNLKKYREICELLGRTEILDNLQNLKKEGKNKLYKYIETLAFHPSISMEEVFKLWEYPESFLQNNDTHTSEEVHNHKKPSNYIEIPNLDLTATELRDALVEGSYDRLQAFTPMEIIYEVGQERKTDIRENLARQIGVRDKELRKKLGIIENEELKSDSKLFAKLNQFFKKQGYDFKKYLNGEENIPESVVEELEQFRSKQQVEEYRVKINKKSDPDGVVAGNDTACCMPFGSGKNNVYTFNPICALFTVQKKNADGNFRTIAQSVLTLDKDINENVAKLLSKLNSIETKLHEVISEDVLLDKSSIITCDNIELAENYKNHPLAGQILEEIYRDFFQEYVKNYSAKQNLDTSKVIIGQGYSDSLRHLPEVNNTFMPEAPVGYSDNLHEKAYLLDLTKETKEKLVTSKKIIPVVESEQKVKMPVNWPKGISFLTYRDSLPVAYIEGKAYRDNESLIQYLHNMENALIAKDINNEAKNRVNMSFKYQDSDSKIHGYILAYEGRRNNSEYNNKEEHETGEKVLYVSDLASDGNKRAGGSLLIVFAEEYKRNFLEKDNPIPIYMQLREATSYPIILKQLEKLSKNTDYKFKLKELGTYQHGDDTMHEAIIRAEKINK